MIKEAYTLTRTLSLLLGLCLPACSDARPVPSADEQLATLREAGVVLSAPAAERLTAFLTATPVRVSTCAEADLTADGKAELIIIHTSTTEVGKMTLRVLFPAGSVDPAGPADPVTSADTAGFVSSNELPAPVENQRITLRDIDDKPPLEFVVMGSKGIYSGFAIYRVVGGVLTDLFDDGMDDCC